MHNFKQSDMLPEAIQTYGFGSRLNSIISSISVLNLQYIVFKYKYLL